MIATLRTKSSLAARLVEILGAAGHVARDLAVVALAATYDWQQRARERSLLGELDDRTLKDIGLSRADIEPEIRKPFWLP